MKVYLAAPWVERAAANAAADVLRSAGLFITSRWLTEHGVGQEPWSPAVLQREAMADIDDVEAADAFVWLNLAGSSGGMHTELGYAIASHLRLVGVGQPGRNIFHYYPDVEWVDDIHEAARLLAGSDGGTMTQEISGWVNVEALPVAAMDEPYPSPYMGAVTTTFTNSLDDVPHYWLAR